MNQTDKIAFPKETIWNACLLAVCILFYLLFPLCDGPVWCVDSASYVTMDISREPLYPTFLALMRMCTGQSETHSLMAAVIVQSLLAGFSAWYAGLVIKRMKNQSICLQLAAIVFQFAVALLCRFAAIRGSVYTDCIMTEGLGLSLFVLFTLELYLYVNTDRKRHLIWTLFLSFLLINLRKQMLITLIIMGVVLGWYYVIRSKKIRKFCCIAALVIAVFFSCKLTDRIYNYVVRDAWIEHCHNSMGFLCTLLYSSDVEKDKDLFKDEEIRKLYLEIMEQADEQQILYSYAEPGWLSVCVHFADSYDAIGYGIINPVVEGYIAQNFQMTPIEAALQYDKICGEMTKTLLRQNFMPMGKVWLYNIGRGFVNSIARATKTLSVYAAAVYLAMGAAAGILIRQRQKSRRDATGLEQIDRSLSFAFIVMVCIAVNSFVVGLTIFTQPRYMIYSMGAFYTAGCMMLYDMRHVVKQR
ncbi:MAG: hypothetical protein NC231_11115 [Bacillus sp. (in: Bacteria)]|nr:hypothetical protein [Bacillus sp. (in: firmicutes)]MCM1426243.1 hypothetical protein [Eubacterium sp.]